MGWILAAPGSPEAAQAVETTATPEVLRGPDSPDTWKVVWEKFETSEFPDLKGYVSITKGSREITDLNPKHFRLFEDAQEQGSLQVTPENEGVVIALLLDTSGSMRESLGKAQTAVREFVRYLRPEDQAVLISFSDEARILQPRTNQKAPILQALNGVRSKGGTALYDSIQMALSQLKGIPGRKVLVLLTDGSDQNAEGTGPGSRTSLDTCLAKAILQDIKAYEQTQETMALLKILALGLHQIDEGRVQLAEEVVAGIRSSR